MSSSFLTDILQRYWGHTSFRPLQEDIITSVLEGHDTLALLPTGGGKSVCFQVPAMAMDGICIVVSPLIALMKDQVEHLRRKGILATAVYSGMHRNEIDIQLDNCIYGNYKFLYVSPERLQTDLLKARVKQMKVCLLAIDEAHCISQWGYDFRPPYLQIAEFRTLIPDAKLIALTATATPNVQLDIQEKLGMDNAKVFQKSFARANLSYSAFREENKEKKLLDILQKVPGCAVVYVRNRRRTQELATWLTRCQIQATFYHAGLVSSERSKRQEDWIHNRVRVMVATNAFGMGIDKPDVRVVVHMDLPESLEAYYQEAGRAGRDEKKAYAVALFDQQDLDNLERNVQQSYPPIDELRRVYQALANYYQLAIGAGEFASYDFDLQHFQTTYGLSSTNTYYALKKLEEEGFIQLNEAFFAPSKLYFTADNKELYQFQVAHARFDAFIKLLLRMYGGEAYTNFVTISETALAKNFMVPLEEVIRMLQFLQQQGLLTYEKQKDKPQLTFLTPRFDAATLPLAVQEIETRKNRDLAKVRSVAHYMEHSYRCRTQLLLEYFGEKGYQTCGICDNCIARRKQYTDNPDFETQRVQILQVLSQTDLSINKLVGLLAPRNEAQLLETIRQLLASEEIAYDAVGNLYKK
ncbi:MAG: ATP-dependent DNA helicase RecQ [Spirosomataceae bacterium]